MAVEFSASTRFLATLVLVALSIAVWWWLRPVSGEATSPSSFPDRKASTKKKAKKKSRKSNKAPSAESTTTTADPERPTSADAPEDTDDSEDSDAGLSARQVLARRRFQPKLVGARAAPAAVPAPKTRFAVGQRVLARFQGGDDWFPGTILEVRRGNEYHIRYDDDAIEYRVPASLIKAEAELSGESEGTPRGQVPREPQPDDPMPTASSAAGTSDDGDGDNEDEESDDDDGGDDADDDDDDDGWHVVGAAPAKRRTPQTAVDASSDKAQGEQLIDGLTKRQREARRKRERKKEVKEMARAQAQEQGLHARWGGTRSKMKYVAPPTSN